MTASVVQVAWLHIAPPLDRTSITDFMVTGNIQRAMDFSMHMLVAHGTPVVVGVLTLNMN